jgi:imidazolonepropionase-like amidohydrolase
LAATVLHLRIAELLLILESQSAGTITPASEEHVKKICLAMLVSLLFQYAPRAQSLEGSGVPYAITNVTVIDTAGGPSRPNVTVLIDGNRISYIGKGHLHIPKQAHVIDGTGKYLIPGLWDMHVHTFFGDWVPGAKEVTLPLFIANGITGVRDMGSDLDLILAARRDTASGSLLGPRMIVAGPMLDGPKTQFPASIAIATPDDGRSAVDMLKSRGVDFIKIQSYVPREAYFAVADECKKSSLSVTYRTRFVVLRHPMPVKRVSST